MLCIGEHSHTHSLSTCARWAKHKVWSWFCSSSKDVLNCLELLWIAALVVYQLTERDRVSQCQCQLTQLKQNLNDECIKKNTLTFMKAVPSESNVLKDFLNLRWSHLPGSPLGVKYSSFGNSISSIWNLRASDAALCWTRIGIRLIRNLTLKFKPSGLTGLLYNSQEDTRIYELTEKLNKFSYRALFE